MTRLRQLAAATFIAAVLSLAVTVAAAAGSSSLGGLFSHTFVAVNASQLGGPSTVYDDATCPSAQDCYAVGSQGGQGLVTTTSDGGATWSTADVPGAGQLDAISCPAARTCFVGGSLAADGSADPQIFLTTDGGQSWTAQTVPAGVEIGSIGCGSTTSCLAVGQAPTTLVGSVIATSDGGTTWSTATVPANALTTVRCLDAGHCWVAGPGVYFTSSLGASWTDQSPPEQTGPPPSPGSGFGVGSVAYSELVDVEFTSARDGWVVGGDQCGGQGATQCSGAAYRTTDGGSTWTLSTASQKLPFGWQIRCQQADCLAIDQTFTTSYLEDTTDAGGSWTRLQLLPTSLNALACTPGYTFCVAAGGNDSAPALYTLGANSPSQPPTPASRPPLTGDFSLTVTYSSYQGGSPAAGAPAVGHQGSDLVDFAYSCPAGEACGVRLVYPDGSPEGGELPPGDFFGPPSTVPLHRSGDHYYLDFESFLSPTGALETGGGKAAARTIPRPGARLTSGASCSALLLGESRLSLTITHFMTGDGRQVAADVTGSERWPAARSCQDGTFQHWVYAKLTINGVANGAPAPLTANSLSLALVTPAQAFGSPVADVVGAVVTALVVLFITFPAQLFNYTLKDNYEEVRRWWEVPLRRMSGGRKLGWHLPEKRRELLTFSGVLLVGAVLDGFLDPSFGFSASSGLTLASMVLALLVSVAVPNLAAHTYRRLRHRPREFRLHALPAGLAVALVSVVVSRATSFEPGYLYGLVCGIAFATQLAIREEGHIAGVSSVCSMTIAVAAWLVWLPLHTAAALPGAAAWQVLLTDLLAAVFVGGLVGNLVGLLPLNFMQGGTLARWHKGAWAMLYAVTTFGFLQALLRPAATVSHRGSAPLVTALLLFVGFGGASVAFFLYFDLRKRRERREPGTKEEAEAEPVGQRLWHQFLEGIGRAPGAAEPGEDHLAGAPPPSAASPS